MDPVKNVSTVVHKILLSVLLLSCGCSLSTERPYAHSEHAVVTREDPFKDAVSSLEQDLVLELWLHLQRQETRLKSKLENSSGAEAEAILVLLPVVQQQSKEVWQQLFDDNTRSTPNRKR